MLITGGFFINVVIINVERILPPSKKQPYVPWSKHSIWAMVIPPSLGYNDIILYIYNPYQFSNMTIPCCHYSQIHLAGSISIPHVQTNQKKTRIFLNCGWLRNPQLNPAINHGMCSCVLPTGFYTIAPSGRSDGLHTLRVHQIYLQGGHFKETCHRCHGNRHCIGGKSRAYRQRFTLW